MVFLEQIAKDTKNTKTKKKKKFGHIDTNSNESSPQNILDLFGSQVLLGMLVNKVGDPTRKVASKAAHLLRCLGKSDIYKEFFYRYKC